MSSSISGQWMPWPPPISRQCWRCSGVASLRRGNHSNGASSSRPSARTMCNARSVVWTSIASLSSFSAEMPMPGLLECHAVFDDQGADAVQLVGPKAARTGELNRIEPKLGGALIAFDVNVRRLRSLEAVEEETKSGDIHHRRHGRRRPL